MKIENERIDWVDVLKFLGIFAIYLWHLGEITGNSYPFIMSYHVPLFFFISGCMESRNKNTSPADNLIKKARACLVPFFFFSFLSLAVTVLYEDCEWISIKIFLKEIAAGGVRNHIFAYQLWFFTCLFVVGAAFQFIKKIRSKGLILLCCLAVHIISQKALGFRPNLEPRLWYNVDSAMYFLIYYAAGYACFPYLQAFLENKNRIRDGFLLGTGLTAFLYAGGLYFGRDAVDSLNILPGAWMLLPVVKALLLIWMNVVLAYVFREIVWFRRLGAQTLYLCGNEFIIKALLPEFLAILGLNVHLDRPLSAFVYTAVLLWAVYRLLLPLEKPVLNKLLNSVLTTKR